MSASKPCPALKWIDSERIHGLREACAKCPNRKPVSLEKLAGIVERFIAGMTFNGFERGQNAAYQHAVKEIRAYEKELNNG